MKFCDVAISHIRQAVEQSFGELVRCTALERGGTLVQAEPGVDADVFGERARAAIAAAQVAAS